jgi:glucose-6-phosphate 1-dehydrogenase
MKDPRPRRGRSTGASDGATIVIFGSTGNLATTRIIPAIRRLERQSQLPGHLVTLGVDKRPPEGEAPIQGYQFLGGDLGTQNTFSALGRRLEAGAAGEGYSVAFYLATRPELFPGIVRRLKDEGLNRSEHGWRRIMVEKPFGVDPMSAQVLEHTLSSAFRKRDVFRVDHFLGKEGTSQIQRVRFKSPRLELVWNRRFIDHVQIIADEDFSVGTRGSFYDSVGVVRDMIQNHLIQLLCLVAMEPPVPSGPEGVARSKARVLRAARMPGIREVVWGQYGGYSQTDGVKKNTRTPTFAAMKVAIDNARWKGVPFYLRTGKALPRTATEVVVVFKKSRQMPEGVPDDLSCLRICIDPSAHVIVEARGEARVASPERPGRATDEYEGLLLDCFKGDQTRFVDSRFNPLSWKLFWPLIQGWEGTLSMRPAPYEAGTWGPEPADGLLARDGRFWRDGRGGGSPNLAQAKEAGLDFRPSRATPEGWSRVDRLAGG